MKPSSTAMPINVDVIDFAIDIDIHRVHGLVAEFLAEAKANLLDLVAREFMLTRHVVGVALGDAVVADLPFHRDLRGAELLEGIDDLHDLGLALGREHIVGLHVEDVVSRVGHVVDAEH